MSPCPVIRISGVRRRALCSSCWRSSPDKPGIRTSETTQTGVVSWQCARNDSADEKHSTGIPRLARSHAQRIQHRLVVLDQRNGVNGIGDRSGNAQA